MPRYTIVEIKDGKLLEYGRKFALCKNYEKRNIPPDGIYFAKKVGKVQDKNGKKINVLDKFTEYTENINLSEQYELYIGKNPEIAKKYLFKPSDYGFCETTKEERKAILKCDEINKDGMTDIYKRLHQRYLKFLFDTMEKNLYYFDYSED